MRFLETRKFWNERVTIDKVRDLKKIWTELPLPCRFLHLEDFSIKHVNRNHPVEVHHTPRHARWISLTLLTLADPSMLLVQWFTRWSSSASCLFVCCPSFQSSDLKKAKLLNRNKNDFGAYLTRSYDSFDAASTSPVDAIIDATILWC